jgi:hypothetical protein
VRRLLLGLQQLGVAALVRRHAVGRVLGRLFQLLAGQLTVGDRVGAADVARHFAVGDPFDLQMVQAAEIGDLFEGEGGIVHQPHGGGLRHEDLIGHVWAPLETAAPGLSAGRVMDAL